MRSCATRPARRTPRPALELARGAARRRRRSASPRRAARTRRASRSTFLRSVSAPTQRKAGRVAGRRAASGRNARGRRRSRSPRSSRAPRGRAARAARGGSPRRRSRVLARRTTSRVAARTPGIRADVRDVLAVRGDDERRPPERARPRARSGRGSARRRRRAGSAARRGPSPRRGAGGAAARRRACPARPARARGRTRRARARARATKTPRSGSAALGYIWETSRIRTAPSLTASVTERMLCLHSARVPVRDRLHPGGVAHAADLASRPRRPLVGGVQPRRARDRVLPAVRRGRSRRSTSRAERAACSCRGCEAGLDVDGCDVSADMIELCRERADRAGLSPTLFVQPMHELEPPRSYRTIVVCGAFGLGSTREQDAEALARFHRYLEPGGTLVLDNEVPYANARRWRLLARRGACPLAGGLAAAGRARLAPRTATSWRSERGSSRSTRSSSRARWRSGRRSGATESSSPRRSTGSRSILLPGRAAAACSSGRGSRSGR